MQVRCDWTCIFTTARSVELAEVVVTQVKIVPRALAGPLTVGRGEGAPFPRPPTPTTQVIQQVHQFKQHGNAWQLEFCLYVSASTVYGFKSDALVAKLRPQSEAARRWQSVFLRRDIPEHNKVTQGITTRLCQYVSQLNAEECCRRAGFKVHTSLPLFALAFVALFSSLVLCRSSRASYTGYWAPTGAKCPKTFLCWIV